MIRDGDVISDNVPGFIEAGMEPITLLDRWNPLSLTVLSNRGAPYLSSSLLGRTRHIAVLFGISRMRSAGMRDAMPSALEARGMFFIPFLYKQGLASG
jgi:hypothetical protein